MRRGARARGAVVVVRIPQSAVSWRWCLAGRECRCEWVPARLRRTCLFRLVLSECACNARCEVAVRLNGAAASGFFAARETCYPLEILTVHPPGPFRPCQRVGTHPPIHTTPAARNRSTQYTKQAEPAEKSTARVICDTVTDLIITGYGMWCLRQEPSVAPSPVPEQVASRRVAASEYQW